ncbi:short-chain dehydrogenase [Penicillium subrubescens]|uniref:Ndc10 domain-containing protein n=1 Tax=Penicillium subrubescens TaxID=1316194 RepID=A0A1Q5SPN9_9EURO|nr:short-chain dehydrogenase [Penicillium subrubescens]KAJ5904866.1 short-chain dehydrogenase [Penicillium subrubescens]OKO89968.1 hypothetical protein PENSUB_13550 [Penicillium subrubescens]
MNEGELDLQKIGPAVRVDDAEIDVTVDIDLQKVEEDSIAQVKPGSNDAEMDDAAHKVLAQRRAMRPRATSKGYRKGLACWAAFCKRRRFTDADLVHEKKILLFLKEDVLTMRIPKNGAQRMGRLRVFPAGKETLVFSPPPSSASLSLTPPMVPLTPESIDRGYISSLIDLWTEQSSLGLNPYPHPRGALLRGLMKSLKREKAKRARETFEDRAICKLNDGYTVEEYHRLCSVTLTMKDQLGPWLRTRLDIQLLHAGVLRSQSNRLAELPDLFLQQLGGEEGEGSWTPCVILMITDGKTLEAGRTDYTGILRHRDPVLCPLASLALYLFWRFDMAGEPPPDFNSRRSWYRRRLIPGKQQEQNSLSYETQALWIRRAFAEAGIHSSKVTHTMRGASARIADAQGIPEDQIRRAGHWERGSMSTAYLARLPREYMRIAAGFPRTAGNYHLRRAAVLPPVALERRIWPWVDGWLARYDASIVSGCSFANGGLDDCDIAGKQFLDLLAWLRITMLQDAAVLQQQFPLFPLWQHPIFCGPDWRRFADAVLVAHNTAEEPMDMRVRRVLPTLEETMRSTREAVLARVDLHSASVELALREGFARVNDGLHSLRASFPEQLVTVPRRLVNSDALTAYLADHLTTAPLPSPQAHSLSTSAAVEKVTAVPSSAHSSSSYSSSAAAAAAAGAGSSLIPLAPGGWPVQPYDPNVATVEDAWREWHVGLGAGAAKRDSILLLEAKFGCAWRYEQRIRQWHSRRKKVIRMIEQRVAQGHALADVFAQLNAMGKSLDRLRRDVEKGVDLFQN